MNIIYDDHSSWRIWYDALNVNRWLVRKRLTMSSHFVRTASLTTEGRGSPQIPRLNNVRACRSPPINDIVTAVRTLKLPGRHHFRTG